MIVVRSVGNGVGDSPSDALGNNSWGEDSINFKSPLRFGVRVPNKVPHGVTAPSVGFLSPIESVVEDRDTARNDADLSIKKGRECFGVNIQRTVVGDAHCKAVGSGNDQRPAL